MAKIERKVEKGINRSFKALEEREELLDKIKNELHATAEMHEDGDYYLRDIWVEEIINKYKGV